MKVHNRADFDQLMSLIENDTFRETYIDLFGLKKKDVIYDEDPIYLSDDDEPTFVSYHASENDGITDEDLADLATAFNDNEWCKNNVTFITIASNYFEQAPQFRSMCLRVLNLYYNPISEMPELISTPNLRNLNLNGLLLTRIEPLAVCPDLRELRAFNTRLRVPPNPIGCPNLTTFLVLENPYTWLGKYALLILKYHNDRLSLNDLGEQDLAKNFTSYMQCDLDEDDYESYEDYVAALRKYIDDFIIPEEFFAEQVEAVEKYMHETYYMQTYPIEHPHQRVDFSKLSGFTSTPNGTYIKVYPLHMPEPALRMRDEYQDAELQIFALFALIDAIFKLSFGTPLSVITTKIAPYLFDLKSHQDYFLEELDYDFKALRAIFEDSKKHYQVGQIKRFVAQNKKRLSSKFDVTSNFNKAVVNYYDSICARYNPTTAATPLEAMQIEEDNNSAQPQAKYVHFSNRA